MSYLGDIALEKTFDTKFTTVTTTGAPTVLAGSPVVSAYPDNSTTQLTAGITLTVDFDGVVGLNNVRVVATAANGYAAGVNYQLVITTGTVGGVSVVGYVVAEFSIQARSALRPATADRTLIVDGAGKVQGVVLVDTLTTYTGNTPQTGDVFPLASTEIADIKAKTDNLPADPADASDIASLFTTVNGKLDLIDDFLDTEVAAIKAKTDNLPTDPADESSIQGTLTTIAGYIDTEITNIQSRLPAALVSGRMDSNMQAAANGVITAAVIATDAFDSDAVAANAITEIQNGLATAAALAIVAGYIDTEIGTLQTDVSAILLDTGTDGVVVAAASKTGYALSAAGIDEIFDELRAGHNVAGSYGESFFTLESGAAIAGTLSTTQMSTNLTEATDDHFKGRIVIFTSGALLRQATDITAYNGTTKVLTFTALTEAPTAADKFIIV